MIPQKNVLIVGALDGNTIISELDGDNAGVDDMSLTRSACVGAIEEPSSLFKYAHGLAEKHCSPDGHSSPRGQGVLFGQFSM